AAQDASVPAERTLSAQERAGSGFPRFHAQTEDASLGRRHVIVEKHVWHRAWKLLWVAKERASLGRNRPVDSRYQCGRAAGLRHRGWNYGHGGKWSNPG